MISEIYLEKFCIDQINKIGRKLRANSEDQLLNGQFEAYTQILSIIAKEKSYEANQGAKE